MKYLSIIQPPTKKFIELTLSKKGWNNDDFQKIDHLNHAQEDYLLVSEKYPIFIVADGVTLVQYLFAKTEYPNPSPAGEVARIFCLSAARKAEELYETFCEADIRKIFQTGNDDVGEYNKYYGRVKETVDYWDKDFFAATAAIVIIKDNHAYWGTICDSYIFHLDYEDDLKLLSPDCDKLAVAKPPLFMGDGNDQKSRIQYTWQFLRNGLNEKSETVGYGVVTGEPAALSYLNSGTFRVKSGEKIFITTDGFMAYPKLEQFVRLFSLWPKDLENSLKDFTRRKSEEDPEKYGRERSLIAVKL